MAVGRDSVNSIGTSEELDSDLRYYGRLVLNYWKGITALFLICILLAFLWTLAQPRIYSASSSALVLATESADVSAALAGDNLAKSKAVSYKSIAGTRPVAERVANELKLAENPDKLLESIEVSVPTNTAEIRVTAFAEGAQRARELADTWVAALVAQVNELESSAIGPGNSSTVKIQPLGQAVLPTVPVSPNIPFFIVLGGVLGLALGIGYALVRSRIDRKIRNSKTLEHLGINVVGVLPRYKPMTKHRTIVNFGHENDRNGEAYSYTESVRELRTNLNYIDIDNPPRTILITSSVPSEGKSSTLANLAVALAKSGKNVVLIDADLRRPTQTELFDLISGAGLTEVLTRKVEVEDVLQPYGPVPNLQVLGAGRIPPNPSELLGSKSMALLLKELAVNSVVLVDTPPLLSATDAAVLSTVVDGVILAVRAGRTSSVEVEQAQQSLQRVDARVLGAVLNQVPTKGIRTDKFNNYAKYYRAETQSLDVSSR